MYVYIVYTHASMYSAFTKFYIEKIKYQTMHKKYKKYSWKD